MLHGEYLLCSSVSNREDVMIDAKNDSRNDYILRHFNIYISQKNVVKDTKGWCSLLFGFVNKKLVSQQYTSHGHTMGML